MASQNIAKILPTLDTTLHDYINNASLHEKGIRENEYTGRSVENAQSR